MSATRHLRTWLAAAAVVVGLFGTFSAPLHAQRGGGGGGMSGAQVGGVPLTRLETLTADFKLNKDQKKAVKTLLDEAHKNAAPTREALTSSHAAIAAAIAANKGQSEIDAAVKQYAQQAAAMATLEMKALAQLLQQLDPEQRANQAAVRSAFFLMRGIFLDSKRWDTVPDARSY
jgi:Spy/CpxP family protein refolding chaperone